MQAQQVPDWGAAYAEQAQAIIDNAHAESIEQMRAEANMADAFTSAVLHGDMDAPAYFAPKFGKGFYTADMPPEQVEDAAHAGALPFVQIQVPHANYARATAFAITGRAVHSVERIEEGGAA